MISDITSFIGLLIWSGEDFDEAWDGKGYCDVVVKLNIGGQVGKVCAITALTIQLFMILKATNPIFMDNKNRKKIIFDLCVCLITPIFVMATNYIVQVQRYAIFRYQGCANLVVPSVPSLLLYSIWDLGWSIVATVFAVATIVAYFIKRRDVKDVLKCTNSGFTFRRFARLLIFSLLVIIVLCPLSIYFFAATFKQELIPFKWSYVHSKIWGIIFFYNIGMDQLFDKCIDIGLSIIAFLIFGIGSDAVDMYKSILIKMKLGPILHLEEKSDFERANEAQLAKMSSQTRTESNGTSKSGFTYSSYQTGDTLNDPYTPTDIDLQFKALVDEEEVTFKESPVKIQTSDVENLKGRGLDDYFEGSSMRSSEELDYIINMATETDDAMSFNFEMTRNSP